MGTVIIKATRDRDLYIQWDTVADGPVWIGTRADLETVLWQGWRAAHPHCVPEPGHGPTVRIGRADETGSSDTSGFGGWDCAELVVDGRWLLSRGLLGDYTTALANGNGQFAESLLTPVAAKAGC